MPVVVGVLLPAARGDQDHDDRHDDDCRDDPELTETAFARRGRDLGLLDRFPLCARLLATLLAGQVLLVLFDGAHIRNFYSFRLNGA